jgi:hypothetical protein
VPIYENRVAEKAKKTTERANEIRTMNMDKDNSYEIPFGAKDSELKGWEYTIPEGMEAEIKDGKIIVKEKESEDERIRKHIIEVLKDHFSGKDTDKCIAWLEKQGSQNLVDKVEPKFKAGDKVISTISNIPYYITEVCNGYYLTDVGCIIMFNAHDNFELVGQNSAWSEEDEKTTQRIVDTIMKYAISPHSIINGDKPNLEYAKEFESWLKSLKFRIQLQWKPSDEQMHYLSWVANIKLGDGVVEQEVSKHLNELLNDLKNLKG